MRIIDYEAIVLADSTFIIISLLLLLLLLLAYFILACVNAEDKFSYMFHNKYLCNSLTCYKVTIIIDVFYLI